MNRTIVLGIESIVRTFYEEETLNHKTNMTSTIIISLLIASTGLTEGRILSSKNIGSSSSSTEHHHGLDSNDNSHGIRSLWKVDVDDSILV